MPLSVLIADRDLNWSNNVKEELESELYEVHFAETGKQAQVKLYNQKFYAIILSWEIQAHSAPEVATFIKKNHPGLMTIAKLKTFDNLDESVEEFQKKYRVSSVITIDTKIREIIELLEDSNFNKGYGQKAPSREGVSSEVEVEGSDDEYLPIKVDELYSGKSVLFDIFVKLRANRYVKIIHAGDSFSEERVNKYKNEKKVEYFYFHKKDQKKFIQFNNVLSKKIIASEKTESSVKINSVKNVVFNYVDSIYTDGLNPNSLAQGEELTSRVYELIEKDTNLFAFFRTLGELDPQSYDHSFLVTLYATATTKKFEWQSSKTLQSISLAGMLHDIGKVKLPKEILHKKQTDMAEDELTLYKTHPTLGYELLDKCKGVSNAVKQMVLQHHEAYDGSGFPNGLKGSKILLVANILSLVDDFLRLMELQGTTPVETTKILLSDAEKLKKYHVAVIENFVSIFADPEKIKKEAASSAHISAARKLSS